MMSVSAYSFAEKGTFILVTDSRIICLQKFRAKPSSKLNWYSIKSALISFSERDHCMEDIKLHIKMEITNAVCEINENRTTYISPVPFILHYI